MFDEDEKKNETKKISPNENLTNYTVIPRQWTYIYGNYYDLTQFIHIHPGGSFALSLSFGRDGTGLFHSYHIGAELKERLLVLLQKYLIKDPNVISVLSNKLENSMEGQEITKNNFFRFEVEQKRISNPKNQQFFNFSNELDQAVLNYFKTNNISHKAPWHHVLFLMFLTMVVVYSFYMCTQGSYLFMIIYPTLLWSLSAHVFHDASHFAFSKYPQVNHVLTLLFSFFTLPFGWAHQHVISHHVYTNMPHFDVDINHSLVVIRHFSFQEWKPKYKWQRITCLFVLIWSATGFNYIVSTVRLYHGYYELLTCKFRSMTTRERIENAVCFIYAFFVWNGWPFLVFGLSINSFIFAIVPMFIFYAFFLFFSQVSHISSLTEWKEEYDGLSFKEQQIRTSVNYGENSWFSFFISTGLNLQIGHHLYPSVNQYHIKALTPIIKQISNKYNVPHISFNGYSEAFFNWWNHMSLLAYPDYDPNKSNSIDKLRDNTISSQ